MRFTQNVSSSLDSSSALTQFLGGFRYLLHSLHHSTVTCFCSPAVMSTWDRMQLTHMFEGLGKMDVPQRQHSLQVQSVVCQLAGMQESACSQGRTHGHRYAAAGPSLARRTILKQDHRCYPWSSYSESLSDLTPVNNDHGCERYRNRSNTWLCKCRIPVAFATHSMFTTFKIVEKLLRSSREAFRNGFIRKGFDKGFLN